jgi:hypothetical protein
MNQKWPPATRTDHQKFCVTEGWDRVRDARGRAGTHHATYELGLPDGRTLRTRVSHPVDRSDYGQRMWAHILRDQLDVDEATFWACVRNGQPPVRARVAAISTESIPAGVVSILLREVGLTEGEVAVMSRGEAIARVNQHWSDSGPTS